MTYQIFFTAKKEDRNIKIWSPYKYCLFYNKNDPWNLTPKFTLYLEKGILPDIKTLQNIYKIRIEDGITPHHFQQQQKKNAFKIIWVLNFADFIYGSKDCFKRKTRVQFTTIYLLMRYDHTHNSVWSSTGLYMKSYSSQNLCVEEVSFQVFNKKKKSSNNWSFGMSVI